MNSPVMRVQLQGYYFSITGENVASGQKSWEHAFKSWQESKGHNKNMLQEDMTELGLALAYEPTSKPDTYWTMILATPINIDGSEDGE